MSFSQTGHLVKSLVYAKFDRGHRWPISRGFRRWKLTGLSLLVDQESRTTTAGCRDILKYLVESTAPDRVVPLVRVPAVPITFLFATPSSRAAENRIAGGNTSGPKLRWAVPLGIFSVPLSRTDKAWPVYAAHLQSFSFYLLRQAPDHHDLPV